jgi:hypothetical protein
MDDADRAQLDIEKYESTIKTEYVLPVGTRGDCTRCDEPSERLINDLCAPCRDVLARAAKYNGRK